MHKNRGRSTCCTVNSNNACISTELANLIYDKVENNDVLTIETVKQELGKPEKKEQQIELDDEEEKNSYETLLMSSVT